MFLGSPVHAASSYIQEPDIHFSLLSLPSPQTSSASKPGMPRSSWKRWQAPPASNVYMGAPHAVEVAAAKMACTDEVAMGASTNFCKSKKELEEGCLRRWMI